MSAIAVAVCSLASATTITVTVDVFGNVPSITAPNSGTVSASQFNASSYAVSPASCTSLYGPGATCSGITLTEIDVTIQANLSASVQVVNTNAGTSYVGPIGGSNGSFGSATSGTAVDQVTTVSVDDPVNGDVVDAVPTFSISTTNEFRGTGAGVGTCGATGTATATRYVNCLSVAHGTTTFTGTGTDTETGSFFNTDGSWATEMSPYTGSGSVTFTLSTAGGTNNGTLSAGVTIPTNTAQINALTDGLEVAYTYTYSETVTSGVPEPVTMLLVGSGLLGLAFARKRVRR